MFAVRRVGTVGIASLRHTGQCVGARRLLSTTTTKEVSLLQQEIREMRQLLCDNQLQLERTVQQHHATVDTTLREMNDKVTLVAAPLELLASLIRNENVQRLVRTAERFSRGWVNPKTVGAVVVVGIGAWTYRSYVYDRTSEEMADIAARTLRQESLMLTIEATLTAICNSPETLKTLNELLQKVLNDPQTLQELWTLIAAALEAPEIRSSLLKLVESILADEAMQRQATEFFLIGLDMESMKRMLDDQTQSMARNLVLDASVQQATSVGLRNSIWYSIIPSFFWRSSKSPAESTVEKNGP